jgi:hypothetical protein
VDNFRYHRACKPSKQLIMNFFFSVWKSDGICLRVVTFVYFRRRENDLLLFIAGYYRNIMRICLQIFGLMVYFTTMSVSRPLVGNMWNMCHAMHTVTLNYTMYMYMNTFQENHSLFEFKWLAQFALT